MSSTESRLYLTTRLLADEAEQRAKGEPMDMETALEWGYRNGVRFTGDASADFRAVNAVRRLNKLPEYRLVPLRGPRWPLPATHMGGRDR